MYLVNPPPVAPFPTQWMPFGPKAPPKLTVPLPQPEQSPKISKSSNLGTIDSGKIESSPSVSAEHVRIMQKNRKGELNNDRGLKSNAAPFIGHPRERPALNCPVPLKVNKEESSEVHTSDSSSDSDDSVDRGIEEAIQEYLKNRNSADASSAALAAKNGSTGEKLEKLSSASNSVPACKPPPVQMVTSAANCNTFCAPDDSRCSSPESVGSDDSFEQSIRDEIEQFLNQKKLNSASEASTATNTAQSSATVKPKQKPVKASEKPSPKQGSKGLPDKTPSESLNQLHKSSKKSLIFKNDSYPKPLSSFVKPNEQKEESVSRQCEELSDSSSDDGIEEAIQLYQLEKNRLEGGLNAACKLSPEKEAKITAATIADAPHCQDKNSSTDSHKNTDHKKRKPLSSRPEAPQDSSNCLPFTSKRTSYCEDDSSTKCEYAVQATRRAETAAELMCAEAILDISKAILPSQPETTYTISQEKPAVQPASPCASDSSVDSDDSIEQEIRTFLARKAEAETLSTAPSKQSPPNPQRLDPPKQQSLFCNKSLAFSPKGKPTEGKPAQKDSEGKGADSEKKHLVVSIGTENAVTFPNESKSKSPEVTTAERLKPWCRAADDSHLFQVAAKSLASLPTLTGGKRKLYSKTRSRCSGDTSSSLDSDEDLDSAIKDLLRSKQKCKKRPKEGRPPCKKKVRFGETTTRTLESLGTGIDFKDCLPKPAVVKSCLVNSDPQEISLKNQKTNVKIREHTKILGVTSDSSANKPECKAASVSDTSLKLNSALPDHDSSSVDSDDSIEQEIRKFLAERARESAELSAAQKPPPAVTSSSNVVTQTESPASVSNPPPPVRQEPRVLSSSETETILQKVMEKDRSNAPIPQPAVIQRVQEYKELKPQVRLIQRPPVEVPKMATSVHSVIVKRECFVDQNRMVRPTKKVLQAAPERLIVKTGMNGSQGSAPVSGNFVAGLKYISGTDQQLLLNVGKASTTQVATELYSPTGNITNLGACHPVQKKTLILEQPKIVQAPTFSLNAPVVRPALYVVTTKVVKDTPTALCLPINAATYDAGLNLMSIQYCQGQVAAHTPVCATPFSFQQNRASEIVMNIPSMAGEAQPLNTKARESQPGAEIANRSCNLTGKLTDVVGAGCDVSRTSSGSSANNQNVSPIDPGWTASPYISLTPERICRKSFRKFCKMISQDKRKDSLRKKTAELLVRRLRF
ncbi:protein phosphatase 1 regulatory subunit 26 [Hyperolius riggenbachi]|uniref:protein phosphatase 1 regulatory subunit 26 n=1 Tax=Hyperolius riggenbachi TaxID=752182 RepID=UPI0035A3B4DC